MGDIRESPALTIIDLLSELGAQLAYHDPHVPALGEGRSVRRAREEAQGCARLRVGVCPQMHRSQHQLAR